VFGPGAALRVLVADDNKDAADTLAALLELMGHQVRVVYDGQAAVQAAAELDPQLVLLDIGMPKLNGYDAVPRHPRPARRQRAHRGGVTGWGQAEDLRSSRDAGFNHHLVKPIDMAALAKVLEQVGPQAGAAPAPQSGD
jgi:CheY-like chemotaxis protein